MILSVYVHPTSWYLDDGLSRPVHAGQLSKYSLSVLPDQASFHLHQSLPDHRQRPHKDRHVLATESLSALSHHIARLLGQLH